MRQPIIKSIIKAVLLVFILLRPFIDGLTYPVFNSSFQLVIVFLALVWLVALFCRRDKAFSISRSPSDLPIFLFLLVLLITTSFSHCHYLSWHLSLQFITYFLLYWLVINNVEERDVTSFLIILLFSATLVSLYGIYQYFWGLEATREYIATHYRMGELPPALLSRLSSNRIFSTFVYPNMFAGYIVMLFPIGLVMAIRSKSLLKYIFLIISALLLYCLFWTKSVGGYFTIIFISAFFLIFYFLKGKKKILVGSGLFVLFSLIFFLLLFRLGGLPHSSSFQDRLGYWQASLRMVKEGPLLGSGPGTFGSRFAKYKLPWTMETQHAHNNFLEIWVETGIFGLLFFLWLWWNFFRAAVRKITHGTFSHCEQSEAISKQDCHDLRSRNDTQHLKKGNSLVLLGLSLAILAFLVHSFGDFDLYNPSLTTITFFILSLAVVMLKQNRQYSVQNSVLTKTVLLLIMVMLIFLGGMNFREILAGRKAKQSVELIDKNRFSEGRAMLQRALSYQPDNPAYWYKLSAIDRHTAFGQKDSSALKRAIESMQKAIVLNPDPAYYHYKLSQLYWFKGVLEKNHSFLEKGIGQLKEAINRYPTKSIYHEELGKAYELVGEKEKAKKEYKKAEKLQKATTNFSNLTN